MAVALYPGAFKPPHRGHFELVKSLLNNSAKGTAYTLDTYKEAGLKALERTNKDYDKVDKVVIFIGGAERNGLKQSHAEKVWQIYAKHLPGAVEIIAGSMNPMLEAKGYASSRPDDKFYAITGIRDESDLVDLKRLSTFKNLENVEGLIVSDSSEGPSVRATNFRKAILSGNLDEVSDFFPKELSRKEILDILKMLKDSIIAEMMEQKIETIFTDMFTSEEELIEEASSAPPVRRDSILSSEDRAKLVRVYNQLRNVLGDDYYKIDFNQDHIRVALHGDKQPYSFDYTPYMASILEYMIDQKMNVTPLPEIKIRKDLAESENFFGKTAYYDPNNKEVVLYVQGRHPKDVMRSFTHEMIHHIQNLEGRLNNIQTQNTNEDAYLQEIEKEAYLLGNITFRNWEDSVKNPPQPEPIQEGVYDSLVTRLAKKVLIKWISDFNKDPKRIFSALDTNVEEEDAKGRPMEFDFIAKLDFKKTKDRTYSVDGGANEGDDDSEGFVALSFQVDPRDLPEKWETIAMDVRDVLRHELEHLTQGGWNVRSDKAMADDAEIRDMINKYKLLAPANYFLLDKEVDAMIQGMYYKAKKSRKPFKDVVDYYLSLQPIDAEEKQTILNRWRKRLPALGIRQEL